MQLFMFTVPSNFTNINQGRFVDPPSIYRLVIEQNQLWQNGGKWTFYNDFPLKNLDVPSLFLCLPKGNPSCRVALRLRLGSRLPLNPMDVQWMSIVMGGTPIAGWFIKEKAKQKWMIWRQPYFRKPLCYTIYIYSDMQKNIQLNVLPSGMFCCHIADGATATESTTGRICVHPAPGLGIFVQNTLW